MLLSVGLPADLAFISILSWTTRSVDASFGSMDLNTLAELRSMSINARWYSSWGGHLFAQKSIIFFAYESRPSMAFPKLHTRTIANFVLLAFLRSPNLLDGFATSKTLPSMVLFTCEARSGFLVKVFWRISLLTGALILYIFWVVFRKIFSGPLMDWRVGAINGTGFLKKYLRLVTSVSITAKRALSASC